MTHKLISLLIAALLTTSLVAASGLTISGVYYDPIQAESGGEAIQLENGGAAPISLDSVTVATKQSSFSLPSAILLPGQGYLITDNNWSQLRDNVSWPDADYELSLSLANTAGFVAVHDARGEVDRLEWNSSNGSKAREGYLFTHTGETIPAFRNSRSTSLDIPVNIIIKDAPPSILAVRVTDDAPETGIQLLSFNRVLDVAADVEEPNTGDANVSVSFLGSTYALSTNDNTSNRTKTYHGQVPFTPQPPGNYILTVSATDGNSTVTATRTVTVLSSTSITTSGSLVFNGAPGESVSGSFTMTNEGNVAKTVTVQHSIPDATCDTSTVVLAPDESRDVTCTATIPHNTAGTYTYVVHLLAS